MLTLSDKFYFTGVPCRNGHIAPRRISTGRCQECERAMSSRWGEAHRKQRNEICNRWRKNNRERAKAQARASKMRHGRKHQLRSRFNISPEEYEQLLARQDGLCAVCHKPPESDNPLVVDHDHECCKGKQSCGQCIRGIVHRKCNLAIGLLGDSEEVLCAAAKYIAEHRKEAVNG